MNTSVPSPSGQGPKQARQEAEAFIQKYEVNGRLRKPKTNEVYNRIRQIVEEVVRDTFSI